MSAKTGASRKAAENKLAGRNEWKLNEATVLKAEINNANAKRGIGPVTLDYLFERLEA